MTTEDLNKKRCTSCQGGVLPLTAEAISPLHQQLEKGWNVIDSHHLEREYHFSNFKEGLDFTNRVGEVADIENHHPDIHLSYKIVKVILWTHKIDGLTENDFIMASKIDNMNGNQG